MEFKMKKFIMVCVLIVICVSPVWAQGPVVLMGIDAEDGGPNAHGPINAYETVVNAILTQATALGNTGAGILVIGGGKNPFDNVTRFWDRIAADLPVTVTYVNGAANISISGQSFTDFKMIAVISSSSETLSGGLTQAENNALALQHADIANFVNNQHGGLLGFSQTDLTNSYAYLGGIGTFTSNIGLNYNNITPTPGGLGIGITEDDFDVSFWHDEYTAFPDFFGYSCCKRYYGESCGYWGARGDY